MDLKAFFRWLFSENTSNLQIGLFSGWHFFYLFIIFGGTAALALLVKKKETQEKLLRLMSYLTVGLYVADFFIMPLSDSYNGISALKLRSCSFVIFSNKSNRKIFTQLLHTLIKRD